jgi:hypothetical protein
MPADPNVGGGGRKRRSYKPVGKVGWDSSKNNKRVRPISPKKRDEMAKKVTPAKATIVSGGGSAGSSSPKPKPPSNPPKKEKEDKGRRTRTRPNEPRGKAGGQEKNPPGQKKQK